MLSKSKIKWIHSLERKKIRDEEGLFVAEGRKIVSDLLPLLKCRFLMATPDLWQLTEDVHNVEIVKTTESEYRKASFQKSPQGILAVFEKPKLTIDKAKISQSLFIALDNVQDPGNLGTIIRLADWYGIKDVVCSLHTADVYAPKAVQATMGAIGRVRIHYTDLPNFVESVKGEIPVFGTFMEGKNIYETNLPEKGMILLGNEGNGISAEIERWVDEKLSIPSFSVNDTQSESLNVGIAAAIVISEFKRNKFLR